MSTKTAGIRRSRVRCRHLDAGVIRVLSETRRFLKANQAQGYVVGGFLRDLILGTASDDLDLVVAGVAPSDVARRLHARLGFSRPVVFPRFKTALTAGAGFKVEICELQGGLEEDAAKRDFTMNSLYAGLDTLAAPGQDITVLDPVGRGLADLRCGVLRTPVDPCKTLWLDPLRILRAFRLRAVRKFKLDNGLRGCIPRLVYLLGRIAPERVRAELELILLSGRVRSSFRIMQALGVCDIVLPELSHTYGFDQATPYHAYDLFTHTLKTVANVPPDITLRLAALLHDLGKPYARSMKGGRAVYYGHQEISADLALRLMLRLRFPRRVQEQVVFLVKHHMIHYSRKWSDRAVRRFARKMGAHLDSMLELAEADQQAQLAGPGLDMPARDLRRRIRVLQETNVIQPGLPVGGHEIMEILGIPEGPLVGETKDRLWEEALRMDRPMSRQEAIGLLRKWARRPKRGGPY